VDGKKPSDVNAKTILICSSKKSHYEYFDKYSGSKLWFMPTWKFNEILSVRDILYKNKVSKKMLFGSGPRFVLEYAHGITQ
jgi:hypothetical protein